MGTFGFIIYTLVVASIGTCTGFVLSCFLVAAGTSGAIESVPDHQYQHTANEFAGKN